MASPLAAEANGCLQVVNQTGGSAQPAVPDHRLRSVEQFLRRRDVHSVCQNCKIILVEANSESNADLATACKRSGYPEVTEITNSYGSYEAARTSTQGGASNHPGIPITASAGDDGGHDFDLLGGAIPSPYNQPNAPASLNTVVAVGGTSLYLGQTATRESETVWNDNGTADYYESLLGFPLGATGGGVAATCSSPKPGRAKCATGRTRPAAPIGWCRTSQRLVTTLPASISMPRTPRN